MKINKILLIHLFKKIKKKMYQNNYLHYYYMIIYKEEMKLQNH